MSQDKSAEKDWLLNGKYKKKLKRLSRYKEISKDQKTLWNTNYHSEVEKYATKKD